MNVGRCRLCLVFNSLNVNLVLYLELQNILCPMVYFMLLNYSYGQNFGMFFSCSAIQ